MGNPSATPSTPATTATATPTMTDADRDEIERYLHFEHFMRMLKIQAYAQVRG